MRTVANGREHCGEARHVAASQQMAFHARCLIPAEIIPSSLNALLLLFMDSSLFFFALDLSIVGGHCLASVLGRASSCTEQDLLVFSGSHSPPSLPKARKVQLSWESCWRAVGRESTLTLWKRSPWQRKVTLMVIRKMRKLQVSLCLFLYLCQSASLDPDDDSFGPSPLCSACSQPAAAKAFGVQSICSSSF